MRPSTLTHLRIAAFVLLSAPAASAQVLPTVVPHVRVLSEPTGRSLVEVAREWSALTRLGDLRMNGMAEDDVEVRIWWGFGLGGTTGGVLRRQGGVWEQVRIGIREYEVASTDALAAGGNLLPLSVLASMSARCEVREVRHMGSHATAGKVENTTYSLTCPELSEAPVQDQDALAAMWRGLIEAGVRTVPPETVPRRITLDGASYVIEVREGGDYRASVLERLGETEDERSKPYREIVRLLARSLLWY